MLKVFTCTDHNGHWPVGVASVVVARSDDEARRLLDQQLLDHGLDTSPYTLREIQTDRPQAFILADGEY